jgi:CheY-like chemotaxis protein
MDTEMMNIKKILLVEDDPRDVELTMAALEEYHLANQIAIVGDGEKALDYFTAVENSKPARGAIPLLVLLDNKMPKVSGLEVLKIIKSDEHLKTIPVVALTSSRETSDLVGFYKHGVNAYVTKPVDFSEFIKAVKHLGVFWVAINEPPPNKGKEETPPPGGEVIFRGKKEVTNENSTPHPAPGG